MSFDAYLTKKEFYDDETCYMGDRAKVKGLIREDMMMERYKENKSGRRAGNFKLWFGAFLALLLMLVWTMSTLAAERLASSAQRVAPSTAPAQTKPVQPAPAEKFKGTVPLGTPPIALECGVYLKTQYSYKWWEFVARNTTRESVPAGMRIKWTVHGSMITIHTDPQGKNTSTQIPFDDTGEYFLEKQLAAGQQVTLKSVKGNQAVGYSTKCEAFATP